MVVVEDQVMVEDLLELQVDQVVVDQVDHHMVQEEPVILHHLLLHKVILVVKVALLHLVEEGVLVLPVVLLLITPVPVQVVLVFKFISQELQQILV